MLIDTNIKNVKLKNAFIVFITLIGCLFVKVSGIRFPWAITPAMSVIGFYHIGYCYKKNELIIECNISKILDKWHIKIALSCLFVIFILFSIPFNGNLNVRLGNWGLIPLTYLNAIICIYILFKLSKLLSNYMVSNILSYLGRNSIIYLCINHPVLSINDLLLTRVIDSDAIKIVLCFAISVLVMTIMSFIINHSVLKRIIGK